MGNPAARKAFVMDALSVPCFFFDLNGTVLYANESAYEGLGYADGELEGVDITDLDSSFSAGIWNEVRDSIIVDSSLKYESHISRKTGEVIPYEFHFQYFERSGERLICALAFDIHDRKNMEADIISAREAALETAVELKRKTRIAEEALERVNALKLRQDGDYYLTSMLLKPFQVNGAEGPAQVKWLVKQKTQFTYRKWQSEIGGDICMAEPVVLRNRKYTFFVAADAMGKANQGACGALLLGTIVRTYLERTKKSGQIAQVFPERWLRHLHDELCAGFFGFDSLMMISVFAGLVDEQSGWLYYFNAEQPRPVSYLGGTARFIGRDETCAKIGMPATSAEVVIELHQLSSGETLFVGSDGKDDIRLAGGQNVNEDSELFLRIVEKSQGDLDTILTETEKAGKLIDDYSVLSVSLALRERPHSEEVEVLWSEYRSGKNPEAPQRILELDPNHTGALAAISNRYLQQADVVAGAEYLRRYAELRPDDLKALFALAWQYWKRKETGLAIDVAERISNRDASLQNPKLRKKILSLLAGIYKEQKNPRETLIRARIGA